MQKSFMIPRFVSGPFGVAYLFKRSPWVPVWWSVILPGFGHLFLGQNLKGLLLMGWEILINHQAHINLAIYHTILGDIDKAKGIIDYRWAVMYPLVYVFTMFDSYRIAVEYNQLADLERLQKRRVFNRISISVLGIHALDRRNPVMAAFWSAAMTGLGHLYCNRLLKTLVLTAWYLAVVLKSGLSLATYHTVLGHWDLAAQGLDYQWLLFWPSIFVFGIVDAYGDAVEQNLISDMAFKYRMAKYLKNEDVQKGGELLL